MFVAAAAGTVSTKRVGPPPWTEKWQTSLNWLGQLREAYSPGAELGNFEVQRRAETFFDECNHLRYWLQGDVAALPGVRLQDINQHFKNSPELKWCRDIGDTYKHYKRDRGPTARIEETIVSATGSLVKIRVNVADLSASTVDALALAERCMDSWGRVLQGFRRHAAGMNLRDQRCVEALRREVLNTPLKIVDPGWVLLCSARLPRAVGPWRPRGPLRPLR